MDFDSVEGAGLSVLRLEPGRLSHALETLLLYFSRLRLGYAMVCSLLVSGLMAY